MDKQDIIDGLDVILGRRGEKITQGDILIVEAAIMALGRKPQPEERRRYTLNELRRVAVRTVIPQDMHERSALLMLIAALGDPDDGSEPQKDESR